MREVVLVFKACAAFSFFRLKCTPSCSFFMQIVTKTTIPLNQREGGIYLSPHPAAAFLCKLLPRLPFPSINVREVYTYLSPHPAAAFLCKLLPKLPFPSINVREVYIPFSSPSCSFFLNRWERYTSLYCFDNFLEPKGSSLGKLICRAQKHPPPFHLPTSNVDAVNYNLQTLLSARSPTSQYLAPTSITFSCPKFSGKAVPHHEFGCLLITVIFIFAFSLL
jgi:hypothetical protein